MKIRMIVRKSEYYLLSVTQGILKMLVEPDVRAGYVMHIF